MANIFKDSNIHIIKNQVTMFLTAQLMRAEKGNGLKNLNRWINQVENCASSDSLRIQMIRLKADPDVLSLINKSVDDLQGLSWPGIKTLLKAKATKKPIWKGTDELMTNIMTEKDDIYAFAARLQTTYKQTCQDLGVPKLKLSYEKVLSHTVTEGMCNNYKYIYSEPLINDCENTLVEIEKAMQDPISKKLFFKNSNNKSVRKHPDTIASILNPLPKTFHPQKGTNCKMRPMKQPSQSNEINECTYHYVEPVIDCTTKFLSPENT